MVRAVNRKAAVGFGMVALPLALGAASYAVRPWLPRTLHDHFADGAWGFALGAFVSLVWMDQKRAHRAMWVAAAALLAAGYEGLQYTRIVGGAWDPVDLVVQTSAVVFAAWVMGGMKRWTLASEAR
jgi:hypothetical protein